MKQLFKKNLFFTALLITALAFSCKGHDHHDHDHDHEHEHEHEHDDAHSSVHLTIIKDGKNIAIEAEAHRDALFLKPDKSEVSLQDFAGHLDKTIVFGQTCQAAEKAVTSEEEGHHEIYLVNFQVSCQEELSQLQFQFADVYSSIKKVHAFVVLGDKTNELSVEANSTIDLQ